MTTMTDTRLDLEGTVDSEQFHAYLSAANVVAQKPWMTMSDSGITTYMADQRNVMVIRAQLNFKSVNIGDRSFNIAEDSEETVVVDTVPLIERTKDIDGELKVGLASNGGGLTLEHEGHYYAQPRFEGASGIEPEGMPDIEDGFVGLIDVETLRQGLDWLRDLSSSVTIGYDKPTEKFWIESDTSNTGDTATGSVQIFQDEFTRVQAVADVESRFDIEYLRSIVNIIPEGSYVMIKLGDKYPTKISYKITPESKTGERDSQDGQVTFALAPQVSQASTLSTPSHHL